MDISPYNKKGTMSIFFMQKIKKKVDNEIMENKYYKNKETKERRRYKDENL